MNQTDPYHIAVMTHEVVEAFSTVSGLIVDATFGGGGHSRALLAAARDRRILAIDRDPEAASRAEGIEDPRLRFVRGNFADLESLLGGAADDDDGDGRSGGLRGVLFDLGVSSRHLDEPERGFSYHQTGPLDMRMGPDAPHTADDVVNTWSEQQLVDILRSYGEERFARRIAAGIVSARPIEDTRHLADVVASAVPAPARRKRHPARKAFQSIRIAVNGELDALRIGLEAATRLVRPGGRVAVISYHSLEDRIVKRHFASGIAGCMCPPDLPVCTCGRVAEWRSLARKPLRPTDAEVTRNPRSRSARLRVIEKLPPEAA
ncbi:MAG: 16S rRNA (cytosine(1402)-N(4))-methyltransferase RsmH [Acidimicrobiia bacterium]|nr:16S rRNA (cytosine(1402)-N(4))-methyltransferase RsmH [Acidimicrobiia bacterium]